MITGDIIEVMPHTLSGLEWTKGAIGVIRGPSHEPGFHIMPRTPIPSGIKVGWWVVSLENSRAKGGYALASLPDKYLAPHACTSRCPQHLCL